MRRTRILSMVAALGAGAVLVSGCSAGGDPAPVAGGTPSASPVALSPVAAVQRASELSIQETSARVDLTLQVDAAGRQMLIGGGGEFDLAAGVGSMSLTLPPEAGGVTVEQVVTRDAIYVQMPGQGWIKVRLADISDKVAGKLGASNLDPSALLGMFKDATEVTEDGTATVRGVATTKYTAQIDLAAVVAAAGLPLPDGVDSAPVVPVSVWIGEDGLPRRVSATVSLTVSGQTVSSAVTVDLFDYGQPVTVEVPSDADVRVLGPDELDSLGA